MISCDRYRPLLRHPGCRGRAKYAAVLAMMVFAAAPLPTAGAVTTITAGSSTMFSSGAGEVRDLTAASASVMYAATQGGGWWKTSNAGVSWTVTTLPARYVWKIAVAGN